MNGMYGVAGQAVASNFGEQKQYGTFGNRVDRAKDHAVNNLKTGVKVVGATILTAGVILTKKKNAPFIKRVVVKMGKGIQELVNAIKDKITKPSGKIGNKIYNVAKEIGKGLNKAGEKMVKDPKTAALGAFAVATGLLVTSIIGKHFYNSGKIDQKYEDKARTQDILTKMDA